MRRFVLILLLISQSNADPINAWNTFERDVRDGIISKDSARSVFTAVYAGLLSLAERSFYNSSTTWRLPVEGCSLADIGKGGFRPGIRYGGSQILGYDFYDGNQHGGHPAYDIFIHDKNMDCRDDRTKKAVNVLAPVNMIVLTASEGWKNGSTIRGGIYVWALAADSNFLFYFAHLDTILSTAGSLIKKGEALGTVGRTGKNAASPRSPTHLHMMVLRVDGRELRPVDFVGKFE